MPKGHNFQKWENKYDLTASCQVLEAVLGTPRPGVVVDARQGLRAVSVREGWGEDEVQCRLFQSLQSSLYVYVCQIYDKTVH